MIENFSPLLPNPGTTIFGQPAEEVPTAISSSTFDLAKFFSRSGKLTIPPTLNERWSIDAILFRGMFKYQLSAFYINTAGWNLITEARNFLVNAYEWNLTLTPRTGQLEVERDQILASLRQVELEKSLFGQDQVKALFEQGLFSYTLKLLRAGELVYTGTLDALKVAEKLKNIIVTGENSQQSNTYLDYIDERVPLPIPITLAPGQQLEAVFGIIGPKTKAVGETGYQTEFPILSIPVTAISYEALPR